MAFTYCPSCGYKNMHGVHSPKFCGGCGATLGEGLTPVSRRTPANAIRKRSIAAEGPEDPEGTDVYEIPLLNELKYTVSHGDFGANKVTLGDLSGEITEDQLTEVQASERGLAPKKRGRPKGSKNSTHGKRKKKRK